MENQINVGVQRQSYEPFEQADSEAENSGAEASLADDSAGANTRGNPDIVSLQVEGESVSEVPPEIVATNNMLNRYSIGDTVILGRPDYTFNTLNNPEVLAESVFAPNETAEAMPLAAPNQPEGIGSTLLSPAIAKPALIPTGFIPAPALQTDPAQICPGQTEPASSGLEPTTPVSTKPLEKADATPSSNTPINGANGYDLRAVPYAPRDCADYQAARAFGAAHGYSEIKTEKFAALLHYQDPQNRVDYCDSLKNSPDQISIFLDLVPTNADGTFNPALGQRLMDERFRAPALPDDPDAGNRFREYGGGVGRDFLGGPDFRRAGAGQGDQDYANEMTMAAPGYGSSYDYDDRSNTYDSPDSTYDDPGSSPQIDLDPLPSLPPVDSSGPMMLPPPDIRLDRELAQLLNISVADPFQQAAGNTSADAAQTSDRTVPGISETTAPDDSTRGTLTRTDTGQGGAVSGNPGNDASRPLYGFNTDGQPLFSTGSRPSQGEYRAAPDAPSLMAGDPVLREDATGATPLRDENGTLYYRVNGGSMDGQIIYVQPTTPTAQNEQPATTLETGGTADRSGDIALGFAPLTLGSTAASRLGAQLASEVLAAEMEFGPPQLRLAAAATLTGVALWAAGRRNTDYEALSPEELDRLRQPLINVPPPPLPPLPGLVPPPAPDNSILPGTSTQPNNLPPLEGFLLTPRTPQDFITTMSLEADPARNIYGPGTESHPEEIARMRQELANAGVVVIEQPGTIGYGPGNRVGEPGRISMDPNASYSAWLHEFQHAMDDQAIGWGGFPTLYNVDLRIEWELRAYDREISFARQQGQFDLVRQLENNMERERQRILEEHKK
jgi:hypothetical protein